jgi:hypothetical protein
MARLPGVVEVDVCLSQLDRCGKGSCFRIAHSTVSLVVMVGGGSNWSLVDL